MAWTLHLGLRILKHEVNLFTFKLQGLFHANFVNMQQRRVLYTCVKISQATHNPVKTLLA